VAGVGRTSVSFAHEVVAPDGGVSAEARAVLVAWDTAARAARELSPLERERLTA
jgi:acyl-CoA thioesterase FadM